MIGKISMGKSFRGCIAYLLENKKQEDKLAMNNRAEIINYNYCFGNKKELIEQFNDLRQLNLNLSKPVLHVSLSLAPGERVEQKILFQMIEACAQKMGFENNQYLAVEHSDTHHQHVHIVVNRIGTDGKTLSDSNNYKKIAEYCRGMEIKFGLEKVLSPKKFLPKEQRQIPRIDLRKEGLRKEIGSSLSVARSYHEFEQLMKARAYQIIKARGIAFVDKGNVRVKGSEIGYSLKRIEQLLSLSPSMRKDMILYKEQRLEEDQTIHLNQSPTSERKKKELAHQNIELRKQQSTRNQFLKSKSQLIDSLLKTERREDSVDPHLRPKKKRSPGL